MASGGGKGCGLTAKSHRKPSVVMGMFHILIWRMHGCMDVYIYTNFRYILKICAFLYLHCPSTKTKSEKTTEE